MSKILILIAGHLCTAPRARKEADTLAAAGHDVIVRGIWYDSGFAERDRAIMSERRWRFDPIVDLRPISPVARSRNIGVRARGRLAREMHARFGKFTPSMLGFHPGAMLKAALSENADLTIVHSEAGLWVGEQLLEMGMRVGVDFEDWFSEDLLPEARRTRPVEQLRARRRPDLGRGRSLLSARLRANRPRARAPHDRRQGQALRVTCAGTPSTRDRRTKSSGT